jgi:hypothetical protein
LTEATGGGAGGSVIVGKVPFIATPSVLVVDLFDDPLSPNIFTLYNHFI